MPRALVLLMCGLVLAGCTTNPTTGRSQFTLLGPGPDQARAIGDEAAPGLTKDYGGEVKSPALTGYISEVGNKLKDQTEADGPQRKWTFTLLDSDVINAFALPGEHVFISRGLADKLDNEAELAGVLGHEIGHVMARHVAERMSQSALIGGLAQIGGAIAGKAVNDPTVGQAVPAIANGTGQVVLLKFSRDQESEADSLGMRYMTKAMYNPKGQLEVMQVLKAASDSGHTPEILATHPLPDTRIQRVTHELETTYAYTQTGPQASKYQFYADRYKQRYLDVRGIGSHACAGDDHDAFWADPVNWCPICRAQAMARAAQN